MTPSEKEFGELIGEVRGLAKSVDLMRTENSADHENVTRRLDSIDAKLDAKAGQVQVNDQAERIDTLEKGRDERKGQLVVIAALLTIIVGPCIVGLFLLVAGVIA